MISQNAVKIDIKTLLELTMGKAFTFAVLITIILIYKKDIFPFLIFEGNALFTIIVVIFFFMLILLLVNLIGTPIDHLLIPLFKKAEDKARYKEMLTFYGAMPKGEKELMKEALKRGDNYLITDGFKNRDCLFSLRQKGFLESLQPKGSDLTGSLKLDIWTIINKHPELLD